MKDSQKYRPLKVLYYTNNNEKVLRVLTRVLGSFIGFSDNKDFISIRADISVWNSPFMVNVNCSYLTFDKESLENLESEKLFLEEDEFLEYFVYSLCYLREYNNILQKLGSYEKYEEYMKNSDV